ncbi:MAG: beta-lactamase family protein [Anaerolineae bacterium]|nr:beta-lactamase family protein [Anaerolineae bacterium]
MPELNLELNTALDQLARDYVDSGCPAVVIAGQRDGNLIFQQAWGWIDPQERQTPASISTLFDLASVTKLFTTTAFLALVSEGLITLDAPVMEIIPEFGGQPRPVDGGVDPHSKQPLPISEQARGLRIDPAQVTFRHLLTHTSGLAAWRPVMYAAGAAPAPPDTPDPLTRAERWRQGLAYICESPFVAPVGAEVRYSDLGLMLLGESVARLSGCLLEQAIQQRVLDPLQLGAQAACFNPIRDQGLSRDQIAPTEMDETWRCRRVWGEVHDENACAVGGVAGHAGLFGTAAAVLALGAAWQHQPEIFGISREIAAEATREQANSNAERRGLGWMLKSEVGSSAGERFSMTSFGHTGFTGTSLWIDPQARLVVACLTNSVYVGRKVYDTKPFRRAVHTAFAELS